METQLTGIQEMLRKYHRAGNRSVPSYKEHMQHQCQALNATPGKLPGYDCQACKNKGVIYFINADDEIRSRPCHCMGIRNSILRIQGSGLQKVLDLYTMENFQTETPLQRAIKEAAQNFISDHTGKWFFVGGQSGSGKTHICTAIAGQLLKQGEAVRYMLWNNESAKLKAAINDEAEYDRLLKPLKKVSVLYIDDLFKPVLDEWKKRKQPNPGDIRLAFELLNTRYIDPDLITIISSEWTMEDLQAIDPATGGRIYQRSKGACLSISPGDDKNYRLR